MTKNWQLMVSIWVLNAYDAAVTVCATRHFGMIEYNSLMASLLAQNVTTFVAAKVMILTFLLLVLAWRQKKYPKTVRWILVGALGTFVGICIWNTVALVWLVDLLRQL